MFYSLLEAAHRSAFYIGEVSVSSGTLLVSALALLQEFSNPKKSTLLQMAAPALFRQVSGSYGIFLPGIFLLPAAVTYDKI